MIADRPYHDTDHGAPVFFVGNEVERSPAQGQRTLFVVGLQDPDTVHAAAQAHRCDHIYFGANQSFDPSDDDHCWGPWTNMIRDLLQRQRLAHGARYLCTLDFDVQHVAWLLDSGLTEHNNFIPMISVKIPYVAQLGYNATVKIDDRGFAASNPGVWCHSLHDLTSRDCFTSWHQYHNDEIID